MKLAAVLTGLIRYPTLDQQLSHRILHAQVCTISKWLSPTTTSSSRAYLPPDSPHIRRNTTNIALTTIELLQD